MFIQLKPPLPPRAELTVFRAFGFDDNLIGCIYSFLGDSMQDKLVFLYRDQTSDFTEPWDHYVPNNDIERIVTF